MPLETASDAYLESEIGSANALPLSVAMLARQGSGGLGAVAESLPLSELERLFADEGDAEGDAEGEEAPLTHLCPVCVCITAQLSHAQFSHAQFSHASAPHVLLPV